jgi:formylmethanofuran:tetrahydromethanopterin formyltransferase
MAASFKCSVIQVIPNQGVIVFVDATITPDPADGTCVMVYGPFFNSVEGDKYKIIADRAGSYEYTDVFGAYRKIMAYSPSSVVYMKDPGIDYGW